jgi:hypothetical protein
LFGDEGGDSVPAEDFEEFGDSVEMFCFIDELKEDVIY